MWMYHGDGCLHDNWVNTGMRDCEMQLKALEKVDIDKIIICLLFPKVKIYPCNTFLYGYIFCHMY